MVWQVVRAKAKLRAFAISPLPAASGRPAQITLALAVNTLEVGCCPARPKCLTFKRQMPCPGAGMHLGTMILSALLQSACDLHDKLAGSEKLISTV